ncbi:3alpha(or 20beta)-hydroxysteroid dehydrogenase [Raineyella antarctica]|uniref:3alpha(Or 20beta)-hydroxysteroid dehydrogenase n=1 Tax=Raineyella antarctica TaxID=1577474 RepID=A0A1G6HPW8_9ACTN|nr:SDR family oxidoreductase [Raineyella antarctica]SDB96241.1 3alpha(or 20beta)-hydroxysteroid dehydrogenase [Raineyella antarctica]
MIDWFTGRTFIVTGGARGQGETEVRHLVGAGARVIIADINVAAAQAVADSLAGAAGQALATHLDVTSPESWAATVALATEGGRVIDGLVNNAGIAVPGRLGQLDVETWDRSFAVNVTGAMLGIQAVMDHMSDDASIINVGSVASMIAHHNVAYGAAKWALRGLSKSAAVELAPRGIRVNMIHPGYIRTPINADADPTFLNAHLSQTPQGRAGTTDEIASVAMFLLSPASAYVTGVEIPVDGGFTSHNGNKPIFDALDAMKV